MNEIHFQELVIDVGEILLNHLEHCENNGDLLITYGDVARQLPYEFNPRNLDHPLGELSDLCKELRLPLISTIVVNKDTLMPGAGYFSYFFPGVKGTQQLEVFVENYNQVKKCRDWSPLAKELGLQ